MKQDKVPQSVSEYIVCREDCTLQFLEALAMNGLAVRAYIEECSRKNFQRIVIELINGEKVYSKCYFREEIAISIRIINVYIGYARSKNLRE